MGTGSPTGRKPAFSIRERSRLERDQAWKLKRDH